MVVKSKIGGKRLQKIFEKAFGNVSVLARESGYRVLMTEKTDKTAAKKCS
jgi:16S rRNA G1207 methylase RsmC